MLNEDPPEPSASNATSVTKKNPSIACEGCKVLKRKVKAPWRWPIRFALRVTFETP